MQILCFDQKIKDDFMNFYNRILSPRSRIHNLHNTLRLFTPLRYQCVIWLTNLRNFVIYRGDWLSIKFCENDSFRKLFMFFEHTFQYLGGISQDISVSHFDSRRSLSLANRRRSTSLILFVSFTQPCDQHDRKIRMIHKSAAQWRGRRARDYRKLILR